MIYLASSSPRRQELLNQIGVSFEVIPQFVEEVISSHESPEAYASRLALEKATDGLSRQTDQTIPVLGSDTVVTLDDMILGKPKNKSHAIDMLLSLSERTHQVITAVALKNNQKTEVISSATEVSFSKLTKKMCEVYWHTGEPLDKAGSYAIQGKGALFINNINGSYSGVMGLPIYETRLLLHKFDIELT